ncbi:MAG: NAD(P)/FAD-dependent oxidoreductase [Deltaproteobacteria bacterium]|nr:NAD(P)/FAD-dependent oxidoreductase [Deltaproteobacteria bacterium]
MSKTYDAILIGAGHNALTCAAYLAKAGKRVVVLERRELVGGATVTEEHLKGFRYSACSYVVSLLRPYIIRDLELAKHGFEVLPLESVFTPHLDGSYLMRGPDAEETRRNIARFSRKDAEAAPRFGQAMAELSRLIKPIIESRAPSPTSLQPKDLLELIRLGGHARGLGNEYLSRAIKMMTMSAVDFLGEWFESDRVIAAMSVSGIIGTFLGVRSPGTAYVLLHHYMGEIDGAFRAWGLPKGGTGGIADALANSARAFGADIRTSSGVQQILVKNDEAYGVVLENGDELKARTVISGVDPHLTFLRLVEDGVLENDFTSELKRFKMRGSSGKVNIALDGLPDFTCLPGFGPHLQGDITIAPSVDYLEKAYDEAKYGAFSRRPFIDVTIPSLTDPTLAPPGKHVMSIFVQYAPYDLKEGASDWENQREAFGDTVIDTLAEYAPNVRDHILHRQILTPWDLEKTYGLTEGNIFHGELSLEQLAFLRPVVGYSRYASPIRNLWMCASGTHPGGGIMGTPGHLCADAMLRGGAV